MGLVLNIFESFSLYTGSPFFPHPKKSVQKTKIIKPVFKDFKNGDYKIISFFAKKARGMMARFIIKNRLMKPQQLAEFNFGGYQYSHEESTDLSPVFLRDNVN